MLKMWKENINFKSCEQREGGERLTFIFILFHFLSLKTKAGKAKRFSIQKYALIFIGSTSGDIPLRTAPLTREGLKSLIIGIHHRKCRMSHSTSTLGFQQ